MQLWRSCVVAAFLAALTGVANGAEPKRSVYTRHVYAKCPSLKSETPVEVRSCLGAGVNVFWTADDDGAVVSFGKAPIKESLDLAPFMEAGDTIEWRASKVAPEKIAAVIVRYRIGQRVGALNATRLVVYRLEPNGRSCVMAIVKEPGANAKARDLADAEAEKFSCGRSARLER